MLLLTRSGCGCVGVIAGQLFFTDWSELPDYMRMTRWDRTFKVLFSYPQVRGGGRHGRGGGELVGAEGVDGLEG